MENRSWRSAADDFFFQVHFDSSTLESKAWNVMLFVHRYHSSPGAKRREGGLCPNLIADY